MNLEPEVLTRNLPVWADGLDGQEDELEEAEREEKEAKERGDDEPDEDLIKQERLNKH
jgi:hypothetical protein